MSEPFITIAGEWESVNYTTKDTNDGWSAVECGNGLKHVVGSNGSRWVEYEIAEEMYELLEGAKQVMLSTYDVTDYPADGYTDCDKCAADIDNLLAKARGEV